MPWLQFFQTTVGKKLVMAVSGIILFGFVVGHMAGNLQLYMGPETLNHYGVFLREVGHGGALWIVRGVLLLAVGLHAWSAYSLTLTSWAARPVGYRERRNLASDYASRTMRWTGVILVLFVVYHLLDFTFGRANPSFVHGDIYHNVVASFSVWYISAFYVVAMLCLGLHMYHGVWSMLQTLGLSHPRWNDLRHAVATLITAIVIAGNLSFPVAVLAGLVREAPRTARQAAAAPARR